MDGLEFINRVQELAALTRLARKPRNVSTVVFLRAPSGIGKSRFVDEFIQRESQLCAVRVPILAHSNTDRLGYISHIVHRIDEFAGRSGRFTRFRDFLGIATNRAMFGEATVRAVNSLAGSFAPAAPFAPIIQRLLGADEYNANAVTLRDKSLDLIALAGYISEFITQPHALLGVENIQQIDDRSLILLLNIIEQSHSGAWILEYTNGADGYPLDDLARQFQGTRSVVHVMDIPPLDWGDIRRSLVVKDEPVASVLERYYGRTGGNLRDFFDAQQLLRSSDSDNSLAERATATEVMLKRQSSISAQLIALLATHDGTADLGLFRLALSHVAIRGRLSERLDLDRELEALSSAHLIRCSNRAVHFAHDSVHRASLALAEFERFRQLAAAAWLKVYRDLRTTKDPFLSSSAIETAILFYSFYLGDDVEQLKTLRSLASSAIESLAPSRLVEYVRVLVGRIEKANLASDLRIHGLAHHLIRTLYRVGEIEEAEHLIQFLKADSGALIFYRAAFASEQGRVDEALDLCRRSLSKLRLYRKYPLRLAMCLIELAALRMGNRISECGAKFRTLLDDKYFEDSSLEMPFYLLAGAALPTQEAVSFLRRAEEGFCAQGMAFEANCARITLSQCLGDLGAIDDAERALVAIDNSRGLTDAERYSSWVNRAALTLYKRVPDEAIPPLRSAALVTSDKFSRLLILTNLLIAHTLREDRAAAEDTAELIHAMIDAGQPIEHEVRRIAAYNLSFFYKKFGMLDESMRAMENVKANPSQINQPLWDYWLGRASSVSEEYSFRAQHDFYPPMFAYWQLDLTDYLES